MYAFQKIIWLIMLHFLLIQAWNMKKHSKTIQHRNKLWISLWCHHTVKLPHNVQLFCCAKPKCSNCLRFKLLHFFSLTSLGGIYYPYFVYYGFGGRFFFSGALRRRRYITRLWWLIGSVWSYPLAVCNRIRLFCSAKPKGSICLLVKWADTAFWRCTAVLKVWSRPETCY